MALPSQPVCRGPQGGWVSSTQTPASFHHSPSAMRSGPCPIFVLQPCASLHCHSPSHLLPSHRNPHASPFSVLPRVPSPLQPPLPLLPSSSAKALWHKQGFAFRLTAAAYPPTRKIWLWWLHKALFHFRAAEGGCTCRSVWQAAPEGVCKRQTRCQESHYTS